MRKASITAKRSDRNMKEFAISMSAKDIHTLILEVDGVAWELGHKDLIAALKMVMEGY